MPTMIATRSCDDDDYFHGNGAPGEVKTGNTIDGCSNDISDDKVSFTLSFFVEQRDLVSEIFSFLDPPSLLKTCHAVSFLSSFLTHKHVIRSVSNTLRTETYDQDNECYRRNRHRHRHIQYHKIVVEKLIPNFQKHASTRQTPMQLLRSVSGRYCERCQLDLICVTGW